MTCTLVATYSALDGEPEEYPIYLHTKFDSSELHSSVQIVAHSLPVYTSTTPPYSDPVTCTNRTLPTGGPSVV